MTPRIDPDAVFAESCLEHLDNAEQGLLDLETGLDSGPDAGEALFEWQKPLVEAVFRAIHTVKGDAKSHGREDVIRAAHHMESILASLCDRRIVLTKSVMTGLFAQLDQLRALFAA